MAITGINSEDRLVQATFAEHLEQELGWDSVYAWNEEIPSGPTALSAAPVQSKRCSPATCARR